MSDRIDLDIPAIRRKVLAGDREAFRPIVEGCQNMVYRCVWRIVKNREETEDLSQEVFIKAFSKLGEYDAQWAFSTWLLTIATRTALNAVRSRGGRRFIDLDEAPASSLSQPSHSSPLDKAAQREWMTRLRQAVGELSDKLRLVFGLRHEEGLSMKEISSITGDSESAVKTQLHRARRALREKLKDFSDIE